jgi:hypothetical protein
MYTIILLTLAAVVIAACGFGLYSMVNSRMRVAPGSRGHIERERAHERRDPQQPHP